MLNKTLLIGNVGADVETRYTKTQVAMATFSGWRPPSGGRTTTARPTSPPRSSPAR